MGDAEGDEHQGEEAEEDQANDERQQEGLVTVARETWPEVSLVRQLSSL